MRVIKKNYMQFLKTYRKVEKNILYLILAGFFAQLVNAAFFLILNIYMANECYADHEIADLVSYRFIAVGFFALPFAFYLKGRKMRPVLLGSTAILPILSLLILEAIEAHWETSLLILLILWGVSFSSLFVAVLPFIVRNADADTHTEAIALRAVSWSGGFILTGIVIYLLATINETLFTNKFLLQIFAITGFISPILILFMKDTEKVVGEKWSNIVDLFDYDWKLIRNVVGPVSLIAVGAGLAIPFMNLFFLHEFGMDGDTFSLLGSITSCVVVFVTLLIPTIKERYGYEAITTTQSLAVLALIALGTTALFKDYSFMVFVAAMFYIVRQPFMNLAAPMTSEMTMYYVGKKNQEVISAITSSIWSGSWFVSSQIFRFLRKADVPYATILYITATFYIIGVFAYHLLIKDFRKREEAGLVHL